MDYLNLHTSTLDDARLAASGDSHIATWLRLLRYSIGQENNGVLRYAQSWNEKRWLLVCRIEKATVLQESELWHWRGGDLVVWAYPKAKQKLVRAQREGGRVGGRRKAEKRKAALPADKSRTPSSSPSDSPSRSPTRSPSKVAPRSPTQSPNGKLPRSPSADLQGDLLRKGMEGKGMEGNRKGRGKEVSPEHAEILFELYPRHVGKRAALGCILTALERVSYVQLRSKVQAYRTATATWPPEQLDFIPNPATWFREGRYDDDPATWAAKPVPKRHAATAPLEDFNPNAPFAHTGGVPVV